MVPPWMGEDKCVHLAAYSCVVWHVYVKRNATGNKRVCVCVQRLHKAGTKQILSGRP